MAFISALAAKILLGFALLGLSAHLGSCILVAARRLRHWQAGTKQAETGVTLLCLLDGAPPHERPGGQDACLRSAFAETYRPKEIIFCAYEQNSASLAAIRAAREENAAQSSLLIAVSPPAAEPAETAARAANIEASLVKGFKAARYDYVATALPNAVLPADYIARFFSGRRRRSGALICACLWAVRPRGLRARLQAVFLNSWQARRLALADCFGSSAASSAGLTPAALWNYEALHKAGGIDAFAKQAAAAGAGIAATEFIRAQGGKIRCAALPLPLDLSAAAAGKAAARRQEFLAEQANWLHFYRRFLPRQFYAEILLQPFLPFIAVLAAWGLNGFSAAALFGFIALWYAAELIFCALWGAKPAGAKMQADNLAQWWQTYALLPARDTILPFLWLGAALKKDKEILLFWKNKPADKADENGNQHRA